MVTNRFATNRNNSRIVAIKQQQALTTMSIQWPPNFERLRCASSFVGAMLISLFWDVQRLLPKQHPQVFSPYYLLNWTACLPVITPTLGFCWDVFLGCDKGTFGKALQARANPKTKAGVAVGWFGCPRLGGFFMSCGACAHLWWCDG